MKEEPLEHLLAAIVRTVETWGDAPEPAVALSAAQRRVLADFDLAVHMLDADEGMPAGDAPAPISLQRS